MLLTFNHSFYCCQLWTLNLWSPTLLADVLCNSGVVGSCLVKMCRKTGDGMLEVGGRHLLHLVLLQGYADGWGCPQQGNPRKAISPGLLCLDSWLRQIDSACLLLVITLMKLIHWGFPPLSADSSAGCGSGECPMRLMGSCYICHTPGIACSALSTGG